MRDQRKRTKMSARRGTRTPTEVHPLDPEPSASTNSAIRATEIHFQFFKNKMFIKFWADPEPIAPACQQTGLLPKGFLRNNSAIRATSINLCFKYKEMKQTLQFTSNQTQRILDISPILLSYSCSSLCLVNLLFLISYIVKAIIAF